MSEIKISKAKLINSIELGEVIIVDFSGKQIKEEEVKNLLENIAKC